MSLTVSPPPLLLRKLAENGGDRALLTSYGLSAFLNGWMVLQGWVYREATARVLEMAKKDRRG